MTNRFFISLLVSAVFLSASAYADDEAPTADELLGKIEASTAYKEVIKSGFTAKNERLEIAILEIMATKAITEEFSEKMSEDQLDLAGWILSYGSKAKKLPDGLVKAIRASTHFQIMARKFSGYAPTVAGGSHYAASGYCFNGGYELIAYPKDFDAKLEMGEFARIVALEEIEKGTASVNYVPRRFLTKKEPKAISDFYTNQEKKYPTAVNVSANEMIPKVIESVMKEHKAKQVILDIPYSQIMSVTDEKNGISISAWNAKNPGHSFVVSIPFKKALEHSKQGGWRDGDKPGCEEDQIHVVATYDGTKNLPNKLGQMMVVPMFKAKSVYDEYDFYGD
jgi:hypothetical protein